MVETVQTERRTRGYLFALIGALCGGSVPTLAKLLLADEPPVMLSGLGIFLSGLVLLLYKPSARPTRGSVPYLLFIGIVGAGVAPALWAVGLNQTTAVNASLLANGEVLFTTVIAFSLLGERLSRRQASRGMLIVIGLLLVTTNLELGGIRLLQGLAGNVLILVATVGWGFENNLIVSVAGRFGNAMLSKFRNLIGGGLVLAFAVLAGLPLRLDTYDIEVFVVLTAALAGSTYFFIAALQILGAIRMILVYSLSTVFGALFALAVLGEQVTAVQVAGGALIIAGVYLFRKSEKPVLAKVGR